MADGDSSGPIRLAPARAPPEPAQGELDLGCLGEELVEVLLDRGGDPTEPLALARPSASIPATPGGALEDHYGLCSQAGY